MNLIETNVELDMLRDAVGSLVRWSQMVWMVKNSGECGNVSDGEVDAEFEFACDFVPCNDGMAFVIEAVLGYTRCLIASHKAKHKHSGAELLEYRLKLSRLKHTLRVARSADAIRHQCSIQQATKDTEQGVLRRLGSGEAGRKNKSISASPPIGIERGLRAQRSPGRTGQCCACGCGRAF